MMYSCGKCSNDVQLWEVQQWCTAVGSAAMVYNCGECSNDVLLWGVQQWCTAVGSAAMMYCCGECSNYVKTEVHAGNDSDRNINK